MGAYRAGSREGMGGEVAAGADFQEHEWELSSRGGKRCTKCGPEGGVAQGVLLGCAGCFH